MSATPDAVAVRRGRGRPSTGTRVEVRLPDDVLAELDRRAAAAAAASGRNVTRSEVHRDLVVATIRTATPRPQA